LRQLDETYGKRLEPFLRLRDSADNNSNRGDGNERLDEHRRTSIGY